MEPAWVKVQGRKFALLRNTLSPKAIPRHADKDDRIKRTVVGKNSPANEEEKTNSSPKELEFFVRIPK